MEPHNLQEWKASKGRLYTCARPGRSKGATGKVSVELINRWVEGLPPGNLVVISLMGQKPDGTSEFSFYPFRSEHEDGPAGEPTFQQWLQKHRPDRTIKINEHPTIDFTPMSPTFKDGVCGEIRRLLSDATTVVVMDSGGVQRTSIICQALETKKKF